MTSPGRIAFTIFGLDIMWYGILVASGIVLGIIVAYARAPGYGIDRDRMLDVLLISVPMAIIGARLYYVIFNWWYYQGDIAAIIDIREGGLAIHGGLLAGMLTGVLLCRKWSISIPDILDLTAPGIALGQAIGRWGNFFNSEAHGTSTDLPWAAIIHGQSVHPTFLYESVWCLLLFVFLILFEKRRQFKGQIVLLYGMFYSVERIFVEALRTDSLMIGPFRQAQVISMCIIITCLIIYVILLKRSKKEI